MFRRVEFSGTPQAFWQDLISSTPDKEKKSIMRLERAEVPASVQATATPQELEAAWKEAAQRSVVTFLQAMEAARSNPEIASRVVMIEMKHVGIKCEGRSGPYDLIFFPHRPRLVMAADSNDDSILFKLMS